MKWTLQLDLIFIWNATSHADETKNTAAYDCRMIGETVTQSIMTRLEEAGHCTKCRNSDNEFESIGGGDSNLWIH